MNDRANTFQQIYERSAIEKYFEAKMKNRKPVVSPITDKPISTILVDNPALRDVIQSLVDNGGIYGELGANWVRSNNLRKEAEGSLWRAKSGDIVEMVHVAIGCTEGKHGFCKDLKKALDMCKGIEAWAPNGSETQSEKERNSKLKAHAYGIHGRILLSGAGGLDREKSKSLVLLALAAGKGSKPAAKQLGYAYRDGKFGLPRDDELARMLFSMAKRRRLSPKEVAGFKDKMMW